MLLETHSVTKKFGQKIAVNGFDLSFESGQVYGILGPNGSGKSTFMKMVAGLFHPSSGTIQILGEKQSINSKADVAYMTTEPFIYSHLTIAQVGNFFHDFFSDFDTEEYKKQLDHMELDPSLKVSDLSSGMHSKLKIAATMSRNAKILMLDEPLNGIDLIAREKIIKSIAERSHQDNCLLISSHLVDLMEGILTQLVFVKDGNIAKKGSMEELCRQNEKSLTDIYKEVYA
ncbi:MAG: ABC transporter ATP-binding protein [Vallitaleaceae bacterium]|nr:ABC transporter ATP-binding protein [Vallitaleaceae bacterium]